MEWKKLESFNLRWNEIIFFRYFCYGEAAHDVGSKPVQNIINVPDGNRTHDQPIVRHLFCTCATPLVPTTFIVQHLLSFSKAISTNCKSPSENECLTVYLIYT